MNNINKVTLTVLDTAQLTGEASLAMIQTAVGLGFTNPKVLETLQINNPEDFGKGYGKETFLQVLKDTDSSLLIYPFSVYYDNLEVSYAGRVKMDSMDDMENGVNDLFDKFYIPLIRSAGKDFKLVETQEGNPFLIVF